MVRARRVPRRCRGCTGTTSTPARSRRPSRRSFAATSRSPTRSIPTDAWTARLASAIRRPAVRDLDPRDPQPRVPGPPPLPAGDARRRRPTAPPRSARSREAAAEPLRRYALAEPLILPGGVVGRRLRRRRRAPGGAGPALPGRRSRDPRKRGALLAEAFDRLRSRAPDARLVLASDAGPLGSGADAGDRGRDRPPDTAGAGRRLPAAPRRRCCPPTTRPSAWCWSSRWPPGRRWSRRARGRCPEIVDDERRRPPVRARRRRRPRPRARRGARARRRPGDRRAPVASTPGAGTGRGWSSATRPSTRTALGR